MHITFIQTGGTIDKDYPWGEMHDGYEFEIGKPAVATILPESHVTFTYGTVATTKKDSLDLSDEDRQKVQAAVQAATSERIVITHGTDTLVKTAQSLHGNVPGKTVVLTGAMLPEKFMHSDARFNLGMAVAAVQTLPPGIYIALYGRVVPWQEFQELHLRREKTSNQ